MVLSQGENVYADRQDCGCLTQKSDHPPSTDLVHIQGSLPFVDLNLTPNVTPSPKPNPYP